MTDLLTHDEVRDMYYGETAALVSSQPGWGRLCLDYMTLWGQNKELEKEPQRLHDLSQHELMAWWSKGSRP